MAAGCTGRDRRCSASRPQRAGHANHSMHSTPASPPPATAGPANNPHTRQPKVPRSALQLNALQLKLQLQSCTKMHDAHLPVRLQRALVLGILLLPQPPVRLLHSFH